MHVWFHPVAPPVPAHELHWVLQLPMRIHYPFLVRQAAIAAAVNASINGWKAWSALGARERIVLSVDSISTGRDTVLGNAVAGAFALALIGTGVTFLTFRSAARKKGVPLIPGLRFWPRYAMLMLKNAVFAFGVLVMLTVLHQRWFGEIEVDRVAATGVTMAIAFSVSCYTGISTMREMIARKMK